MKGGSTALLHFVATCCMTRVPERRGGDWARVPRIRDRRAGRVRPRSGPRARCGRGFALKYASRRRRKFPRGAPRRQGTGPCRSTRQNCVRSWNGTAARASAASIRSATGGAKCACSPWTEWKSTSRQCQWWKRTGTNPSHPSASPLNRIVCLLRNCSWGGGLSIVPPEDSLCSANGQVLACGRLRGASIHRAK
jgi:hypothetical protein